MAASTAPNSAVRQGYTLLELMLALALLGALLTVAWSLMSTYRDAEQKGWQLSMRTQTVRAIHTWLQQDIDHIPGTIDDGGTNGLSAAAFSSPRSEHDFRGSATGFSVTIQPSLAPLPFLERLMSAPDVESLEASDSLMLSNTQDSPAPPSLWSDERARIEYRLVPTAASFDTASMATASSSSTFSSASEPAYQLSRVARQTFRLTDPAQTSGSGPLASAASASAASASAADRVLTAQDLYRQTDDQPSEVLGPVLEQSVLNGLVNARFRYFDGRNWRDDWNAETKTLPLAVAISFDMPQRFEPTVTSVPPAASDTDASASTSNGSFAPEWSMADAALASEPIAEIDVDEELSLVENDSHQVHIVVRIPASANRARSSMAGSALGVEP